MRLLACAAFLFTVGCWPDANLMDEQAAPPTMENPALETGGSGPDEAPPVLEDVAIEPGAGEGCLRLRVRANEPVNTVLVLQVEAVEEALAVPGPRTFVDALVRPRVVPGERDGAFVVRATDRAQHPVASMPAALRTPAAVPTVAIVEILANPAGSEYTQEFVELANTGVAEVSLVGLRIADAGGEDPLPVMTLAPGGRALVVAAGYVANDAADPAAPADVPLIRVEGRIGRDGLSNGGEPVRLLDAAGRVVSSYGGWVDTSATAWNGRSVHRRPAEDACDAPSAWTSAPMAPTPGR